MGTWGGRWHRWFPVAFFWATGAAAFGAVLAVTDWPADPGVIAFLVVPAAAALWALLAALLFHPLALVSVLVGACLDAAHRAWR